MLGRVDHPGPGAAHAPTRDRVVLTLPGDEALYEIATLVLGGLGTRLDLPYERLDSLQLAVVSVLSASEAPTVTLEVAIDEDALLVTVGPLPAVAASDEARRRVLARLVDGVEAAADDAAGEGSITLRLDRPRVTT
jgi:hypothetical protein